MEKSHHFDEFFENHQNNEGIFHSETKTDQFKPLRKRTCNSSTQTLKVNLHICIKSSELNSDIENNITTVKPNWIYNKENVKNFAQIYWKYFFSNY